MAGMALMHTGERDMSSSWLMNSFLAHFALLTADSLLGSKAEHSPLRYFPTRFSV
jgi:hypothetical protein